MSYRIQEIRLSDKRGQKQFDELLLKEGIRRDKNLEYIAGMFDDDYNLVAAGACYSNTLRCLAVDSSRQGEGLMADIVTHLQSHQLSQGRTQLFLYTKLGNSDIFGSLGFYEIARVGTKVILMENRRNGFSGFLENLKAYQQPGKSAVLVMNCNPFTLGHRYLVEAAASENDAVHLFVVSEDVSFFPFADRFELIKKGCADLKNVYLHQTGSYMISSAVFPSYFLEDEASAIEVQAELDIEIFTKIAGALGADRRYVGEEPYSVVTGIYNDIMYKKLPQHGLECVILKRKETGGAPISASSVRKLINENRIEETKELVPQTTYDYFFTDAGREVVRKIQSSDNVVHY